MGDALLSFHLLQIVVHGACSVFGTPLARSVSIVVHEAQSETKALSASRSFAIHRRRQKLRTTFRVRCSEARKSRFDSLRSVTWRREQTTCRVKNKDGE